MKNKDEALCAFCGNEWNMADLTNAGENLSARSHLTDAGQWVSTLSGELQCAKCFSFNKFSVCQKLEETIKESKRLAFRKEGGFWNAYLADPGTMLGWELLVCINQELISDTEEFARFFCFVKELLSRRFEVNYKNIEPNTYLEETKNA